MGTSCLTVMDRFHIDTNRYTIRRQGLVNVASRCGCMHELILLQKHMRESAFMLVVNEVLLRRTRGLGYVALNLGS